jgi:hypothetical protein
LSGQFPASFARQKPALNFDVRQHPMEVAPIAIAICAVLALNLRATFAIAWDTLSERSQKFWQLLLVWLLPLLGAIIALAAHRRIEEPSRKYRQPLDAGDDFAFSGRGQKALSEAVDGD